MAKKGGHVDVSRLNGQRVFGANFEIEDDGDDGGDGGDEGVRNSEGREAGEAEGFVRAVTWRRDGELVSTFIFPFPFPSLFCLALGWSCSAKPALRCCECQNQRKGSMRCHQVRC